MFKKKKENLSEEFLRNKDPLTYCRNNYKYNTVFNNGNVLKRIDIKEYKISTKNFSIEYWEGEVILTIYYDSNKNDVKESWTLYRKKNGQFAEIINKK